MLSSDERDRGENHDAYPASHEQTLVNANELEVNAHSCGEVCAQRKPFPS